MEPFCNLSAYTCTVILRTNLFVHLPWVAQLLQVQEPSSDIAFQTKKKWKQYIEKNPPLDGTILSLSHDNYFKGYRNSTNFKRSKDLMNGMTLTIYLKKLVVMRVPYSGSVQMVGCLDEQHAVECFMVLWRHISQNEENPLRYTLKDTDGYTDRLVIHTRLAMSNYTSNTCYPVDRERCNQFFNSHTEFGSLLAPEYKGVNIKKSYKLDYDKKNFLTRFVFKKGNTNTTSKIQKSFRDFLSMISPKNARKEQKKVYSVTFLVFPSGSIIVTGLLPSYIKEPYETFAKIIETSRSHIQEQFIDPSF